MILRFLVLLMMPVIASGAEFTLNIADIEASGFAAHGIGLILADNGSADMRLATLQVQQHEFHDVRLHCGEFTLTSARLVCVKGHLNAMPDAEIDFSYVFGTKQAQLSLTAKDGESWQVSGHPTAWQVRLHNARLKRLAPMFSSEIPSFTQGALNGSFLVGASAVQADLQLADVSFNSALHAAEKLCGTIKFSALRSGADWNWQGRIDWPSGELYWQPWYLKGGHSLIAAGRYNDAHLLVATATVALPEVGRVQFSGDWQQGALISTALHGEGLGLEKLFENYAKPLLAGGVLAQSTLEGRADVDVQYRGGAVQSLKLKLTEAGISDAEKRFSLYGVNSAVAWSMDVPGTAFVDFSGGTLLGAPIGKGQVTLKTDGLKYDVAEASLPVLDGTLNLRDFHLHKVNDAWHWDFSAALSPISMTQLSAAAGWPKMLGTLSGRIPNVSYDGNQISADGALLFDVFDGTVVATGLKLANAFGRAPSLSGNLTLRHLDMDFLTRTFSFGSMQGRLDGDVTDIQLQNWLPVKFDAHLYSSAGQYPRKISQKAVQNISSLGGAGAGAAIQRSYLGIFENFGYERIGIRCKLRNDLCRMEGIDEGGQGPYAIIKGRGIPAISVIGYNRAVSWGELTARLRRVMQDNIKPVVK